jgi:hypothetical protein
MLPVVAEEVLQGHYLILLVLPVVVAEEYKETVVIGQNRVLEVLLYLVVLAVAQVKLQTEVMLLDMVLVVKVLLVQAAIVGQVAAMGIKVL